MNSTGTCTVVQISIGLPLNTGPLPDGSIHAGDAETLAELGRRIRKDGYPRGNG